MSPDEFICPEGSYLIYVMNVALLPLVDSLGCENANASSHPVNALSVVGML